MLAPRAWIGNMRQVGRWGVGLCEGWPEASLAMRGKPLPLGPPLRRRRGGRWQAGVGLSRDNRGHRPGAIGRLPDGRLGRSWGFGRIRCWQGLGAAGILCREETPPWPNKRLGGNRWRFHG